MNKAYIVLTIFITSGILFSVACGKRYTTSQHGENKSHYPGSACIACHMPGGAAKDVFTIGGTVYDEVRLKEQKKAVIKLYTEPQAQGKLVATLHTDEQGNFYSNQKINFAKGLYATLLGSPEAKDNIKHMSPRIFKGDCNSCHGVFEESLGID